MTFDLGDYIDVAERCREFFQRWPEGSLQSEVTFLEGGVLCKAYAYRGEADERPGIGHAFEPIPGKTTYTRDSEVMNAETSAWGRAIVAVGFETKKIASTNEVLARTSAGAGTGGEPSAPAKNPAARAQAAQAAAKQVPDYDGTAESVVMPSGKHKGKKLGDLPAGYRKWVAENWGDQNPTDRLVRNSARALEGLGFEPLPGAGDPADDDIPFAPTAW